MPHISGDLIRIFVLMIAIAVPLFMIRRLGRAAILVSVGFLMLAIGVVFSIGFMIWIVFFSDASNRELYDRLFWVKTGFEVLFAVIGFLLLLIAIVIRRSE